MKQRNLFLPGVSKDLFFEQNTSFLGLKREINGGFQQKRPAPFFRGVFFLVDAHTTGVFVNEFFFSQPKKLPNFPPLFGLVPDVATGDGRVYKGALGPEPQ